MSLAVSRDTVLTPKLAREAPRQHRRSSTLDSTSSTSTLNAKQSYNHSYADGRVPTSPTSSTVSGGSPRSFYSFAQASTSQASTIKDGAYVSLGGGEDDLGDRTISLQDDTPRKVDPTGKGKQRAQEQGVPADTWSETGDEQDHEEDSAKVEQTLRRWAEKEKLRRAKTRSRQISSGSLGPSKASEGIAAVSGLARRMSGARQKGHRQKGSQVLGSIDSGKMISAEGEELELQPHLPYKASSPAGQPATSPFASPPLAPPGITERIERATKTGSRFIEDLEDQEMQPFGAESRPQSYAQLNSNTATPLPSPTKGGATTPRNKLRLKLGDGRANSFSSIITFGSNKEGPFADHNVAARSSMASLKSPIGSLPKGYYTYPGESTSNLALSPRQSRDFHPHPYQDDEEYTGREIGWLEWFFCCACFRSGVQLDEEDMQAGRTFPG